MSRAFGTISPDKSLSNLQVVNDLTVKGTLRAKEIIACGSSILSGSIGNVDIESATINDAVIGAGTIRNTFLENVNAVDFESGCVQLDVDTATDLTNIMALETWTAGDPATTLTFTGHYYRVDRVVHMSIPFTTVQLVAPATRGTIAMRGTPGSLPGRTTAFGPLTWKLSGTGTIAKSDGGGGAPDFGGMFAFAEAISGGVSPPVFNVHWIGDSGSSGVVGGTGGSVTIMYETDGPDLCT
jgi:hypothetical protein